MEELVALCKRRGFIFQSNEIYGGLQGLYDYGPLGVELKNNLKQAWWRSMVFDRDDVEGLDASILTKPSVLKFSVMRIHLLILWLIAKNAIRDGVLINLKHPTALLVVRAILQNQDLLT